jgi:hypothetical protein
MIHSLLHAAESPRFEQHFMILGQRVRFPGDAAAGSITDPDCQADRGSDMMLKSPPSSEK